jgi:hypothetical protein
MNKPSKMKRLFYTFLFLVTISGCVKTDISPSQTIGSVMFRYDGGNNIFVTDDFVDITLNKKSFRIKNGFGLSEKCGTNDNYTFSMDLPIGTNNYTAITQIGRKLSGSFDIKAGYCTSILIK